MTQNIEKKYNEDFGYLVYAPEIAKDKALPLVIVLHGAGERGNDPDILEIYGPFRKIRQGWQPDFICVAPQCPNGFHWTDMTIRVRALIADICLKYNVDQNRIYITGLSMGGFGTWAMLAAYPDLFAAAVPICGGGQPWTAGEFFKVPVWAFHGDVDDSVDFHYSVDMVNAVNNCGGNAKLTVYPGVGHGCWDMTYDKEEMWTWLLSNKK